MSHCGASIDFVLDDDEVNFAYSPMVLAQALETLHKEAELLGSHASE